MAKRVLHVQDGVVVNATMESDDFPVDGINTVFDQTGEFGISSLYDAETQTFSHPPVTFSEDEFKNYRNSKLNKEVTVELLNQDEEAYSVVILNDDRTNSALNNKIFTLMNETTITQMAFQANNGWFDLNHADYQRMKVALDLYTQKCFDVHRQIEQNHINTPYTDYSWTTVFDTLLEA
jgi:hypothetical protein